MRIKEPRSLEEIHKIRKKHYEETKDMNIHQKMLYIKRKAERFKKENNIRLKSI